MILLGITVACTVGAMLVLAFNPGLVIKINSQAEPAAEDVVPVLGFGLLYGLASLCRLAYFVIFLSWEYRCYVNLSYFSGAAPRYTAGWAIGAWFVPFLNLVRPFQVAIDLVNGNRFVEEPERLPDRTGQVGLWWILFLGSNVAGRLADELGGLSLYFLAEVANVLSWLATAYLVVLVTHIQQDGYGAGARHFHFPFSGPE